MISFSEYLAEGKALTGIADIDIDVKEVPEYIKDIKKKFNVTAKLLKAHGPGGGAPEIQFTGDEKNLKKFFIDYNGEWDEDAWEVFLDN